MKLNVYKVTKKELSASADDTLSHRKSYEAEENYKTTLHIELNTFIQ
jgi:hypothetical protein